MKLNFIARTAPEPAAGIIGGSSEVTIEISCFDSLDGDQVEFWRQAVSEFFDGAFVLTDSEYENELREEERFLAHLHDGRNEP